MSCYYFVRGVCREREGGKRREKKRETERKSCNVCTVQQYTVTQYLFEREGERWKEKWREGGRKRDGERDLKCIIIIVH